MMRSFKVRPNLLFVAVSLALSAASVRAETTPNPAYESWAKCKPGATVKLTNTSEAMGQKTAMVMTTKLLEVTPEKAIVETTTSMEVMGRKMDQPAQKQEIPATSTAGSAAATPGVPPGAKADVKQGADESLTVAGKSVTCKTSEVTTESNGMKVVAKTWTSTDVPGGLVKMEAGTTGAMASTTKMEVVEFSTGN